MSTLNVNNIEASSGTTITVPVGYSLSLSGTTLNSSTLPPNPSGNSNKFLYTDGSTISYAVNGPKSIQVFTSSGTWTKPAGINKILVQLVGGGGASSSYCESGGAGGYSEKLIDVTSVSSVNVTIGNGSTSWTYYSGPAGAGGTTSFGSYMSASGGNGGNQSHQHCGGLPGVGSGGDFNQYGGGGSGHMHWGGSCGGTSFFGGPGPSGHSSQGGNYSANHSQYCSPGAGATGGNDGTHGGSGSNGIVIVYEYT